jgi:hypothetical protein
MNNLVQVRRIECHVDLQAHKLPHAVAFFGHD